MDTLPLHPLIVHFPLVLAGLAPVATLVALVLGGRSGAGRAPWLVVSSLLGLLVVSGLLAERTGENEEDLVEPIVGEAALHEHEERAELLVVVSGVALIVSLGPLLGARWRRLGTITGLATLVMTLVVAGAAVRVGHSGGELVYVHGAARAYHDADVQHRPED